RKGVMTTARTRFRLIKVGLGALAVIALASFGGQSARGQSAVSAGMLSNSATPKVLRIGLSSTQEVFDPAIAQPVAKPHLDLMYDHLVGLNESESAFSKKTGVASDWSTKDNKSWRFTIRRG